MVGEKLVSGGPEFRVAVLDVASAESKPETVSVIGFVIGRLFALLSVVRSKASGVSKRVWKMGADDPRKVIHCTKVGLALTMVSLFYYTRPLYEGVGGTAMWAVMTVVVVFEYTVGGCLYKGFNRAAATLSAGALAVGVHWLASQSGETTEHVIIGVSVFLLSSVATFIRFIPTIKSRFDYGMMIFILTFSLVAISGYRVDELLVMAIRRASTICIGISITLLICIFVRPVWSGEELHLLVVANMEKLADALEECVAGYFMEGGKEVDPQKSQGYKCILNSKVEENMANLARWEPAHGLFGFCHPWDHYLKIGAALRYSAYCIEALNGCIRSEIQAPGFIKDHLSDACIRLSSECSNVLKESAKCIKSMKKSSSIDLSVGEMNNGVEELHDALRSLSQSEEVSDESSSSSLMLIMETLPLITVASLLIEVSTRIEVVVDAVEDLARLACFEPDEEDKLEPSKVISISNINAPSSIDDTLNEGSKS